MANLKALEPCPFCGGTMQLRYALWPAEGDRDAVIHAAPTACPIEGAFSIDTFDDGMSVAEAWNRRAYPSVAEAAEPVAWQYRVMHDIENRWWEWRETNKRHYDKIIADKRPRVEARALFAAPTHPASSPKGVSEERVERAVLAASPSPPADGVRVKPLEWKPVIGAPDDEWLEASTPFGPYTVSYVDEHTLHYLLEPFRSNLASNYETEQQARAAAQSDYEARIRSSLLGEER